MKPICTTEEDHKEKIQEPTIQSATTPRRIHAMARYYPCFLAFAAAAATPATAFVINGRSRASVTVLSQERTSWSEYKHDYVDPRVPHASPHEPDVDEASARRRAIADEFWLEQFKDEKDKLHHMMDSGSTKGPESSSQPKETWSHYKHDYVEPLTFHSPPIETTAGEDSDAVRRREIADEFWLEKFMDDREKLRHLSA
uniref:Uncharacterized protein n=1 Tax=Pseudictyota dubia TaxID=2749911 RepID=A0A6U2IKH6_9STRA